MAGVPAPALRGATIAISIESWGCRGVEGVEEVEFERTTTAKKESIANGVKEIESETASLSFENEAQMTRFRVTSETRSERIQ